MMLKVGYFPCTQDPPLGENIGRVLGEGVVEAQVAEQSGFDSCLFSEHHQQPDGYIPNTLVLAAMFGMRTERLKVGSCITILPLQHPVHVAEDSAIIDQMTGGRMILSVGVGYQEGDFVPFGVSIKERAKRTEEGIEIIRKCWLGERFSYNGKHYKLDQILVTPKPIQKNGPPIWMAAWTDVGIKRVARFADGWITDPLQSVGVIKRFTDLYRSETRKLGRPPFIALMRDVWVADSTAAARGESGPLMYTHRFYFRNGAYVEDEHLQGVRSEEEWTFERAAKDRFIIGSPDDCREQLRMWQQEIRPDYLILRMRHPGGPEHKRIVGAIRLFGEKVLPHL
jgi:alkanesulfonate monooxygenase SsuD/methylene tetrahydromethanopterin reductase-like flavin-dependent oxidoreductase (luciferase family)